MQVFTGDDVVEDTPEATEPPVHRTSPSPSSSADAGLTRALVLGGSAGFVVVFAMAVGALLLTTPYGLVPALGSAAFIAAFCGIGFGAMVAGSLHT